jgi:hypothetical protein
MRDSQGEGLLAIRRVAWHARPYIVILVSIAVVVWLLPRDESTQSIGARGGTNPGFASTNASGPSDAAGSSSAAGDVASPADDSAAGGSPGGATAGATTGGEATASGAPRPGNPLTAKNCDPETGRMAIPYVAAAPCVADWPAGADNGGSTAPGVTATSVKVVYVDSAPTQSCASTSAASAALGVTQDPDVGWNTSRESLAVFEHFYETYGRKIVLERYRSTGCDEAAQRADAIAVAARKPFITINAPTIGPVFDTEIANRGVINIGWNVSQSIGERQAPYRYGEQPDFDTGVAVAGEFVGKSVAGRPAKWAGDTTMNGKPRRVGLVVPSIVDPKLFTTEVTRYGGSVATAVPYDYTPSGGPFGDPASYQQQAPIIVSKLKAANITSAVLVTDFLLTNAVMSQATSQVYRPEWVITGFQFQDLGFFGRTYDQNQLAHAFGVGLVPIIFVNAPEWPPELHVLRWYYGSNYTIEGDPSGGAGTSARELKLIANVFNGIQLAGPALNPLTFQRGLFSMPPHGGYSCKCKASPQASFGKWGFSVSPTDYVLYDDNTMVWWDPDAEGPVNGTGGFEGRGNWQYLFGGDRFPYRKLPGGDLPFFDSSKSIQQYNGAPPTDDPKNYSCRGCPSARG